jgi:hypothetical protein
MCSAWRLKKCSQNILSRISNCKEGLTRAVCSPHDAPRFDDTLACRIHPAPCISVCRKLVVLQIGFVGNLTLALPCRIFSPDQTCDAGRPLVGTTAPTSFALGHSAPLRKLMLLDSAGTGLQGGVTLTQPDNVREHPGRPFLRKVSS